MGCRRAWHGHLAHGFCLFTGHGPGVAPPVASAGIVALRACSFARRRLNSTAIRKYGGVRSGATLRGTRSVDRMKGMGVGTPLPAQNPRLQRGYPVEKRGRRVYESKHSPPRGAGKAGLSCKASGSPQRKNVFCEERNQSIYKHRTLWKEWTNDA